MRLPSLDHSALDSFPDAPFVSINPAASERQVIAALNPLMKQWKAERGLSQKRDRSENFEQFLRVWDLREGWNAGRYDRQASTLQAVAAELDLPLGTITKQYRRAFELITGHRYSPQAWVSFFGVLKLSAFAAVQGDSVSRRRPLVSPITREVPESRLRGPGNDSPGVTQNVSVSAESDAQPLVDQIIALIKAGETDDTILERTELGDRARPAIEELRSHFGTPRTSSRK